MHASNTKQSRRKVLKRYMKKNPSSSDSESYGPFYSIASTHSTHQQLPPPTPKLSGAEWTLGIPGFTPLPDLFSKVELANFTPMPPKDSEISIAAFYVCTGATPSAASVQTEGPKKCSKTSAVQNPTPAVSNSPVATQQKGATDSNTTITKTTPSLAAPTCDVQDTVDCSKDESTKPLPTPTPSPTKPRRAFSSARAAATAAAAIAAAANTAAAVAAAAAVSMNNNSSDSQFGSSPQQQSPAKRRGRPPSSFSAKYSAPPPPVPISFFSLIAPSPVVSGRPSASSLSELEGDEVEGKDLTEEHCQEAKLTVDCQGSSPQAGETDAASANNAEVITPTTKTESPFHNSTGIPTLDSTDSSPVSDSASSHKDAMTAYPISASPVKHRRQHVLIAKSRRLTDAVALLKEQRRAEAEGLKKLLKSRVGALGTYGAELRRFVVGGSGDLGSKDGEENEQMDEDERGKLGRQDRLDVARPSKKGLLKKTLDRHDDEGKSVMSDEDEPQMGKDILHTAAYSEREKRKRPVSVLTESEIGGRVRPGGNRTCEDTVNNYAESAGKPNSPTMKLSRKKLRATDKFAAELPHHFPTHSRRPGSPHSTASGDSNASKLDLTLLLSSAAELLNQSDSADVSMDNTSQGDEEAAIPATSLGEGKEEQLQSSGLDLLALLAADGLF
ncbi:hypothetical protein HDU80_005889 [Chytriomyces hyalinus]|nr:hypothetical protein HDU80_005889 [Chytriomyces hyalinus]